MGGNCIGWVGWDFWGRSFWLFDFMRGDEVVDLGNGGFLFFVICMIGECRVVCCV